MGAVRVCALLPTFDNPRTIGRVVGEVRKHLDDVIVVDDGSGEEGRAVVAGLARDGLARVVRRETNGGKGAAVKTGFFSAREQGFSHALQIDADGQHCTDDLPRFIAAAVDRPEALILGVPVFDETQPFGRAVGRKISQFWVNFETGGQVIDDPQCGFRVYPLEEALAAGARGDRMQFDQELPVRMIWRGVPVVNLPTRVRYLAPEEGGVSHFQMFRDNLRISAMHTGLVFEKLMRFARVGT
ncbi:MAG: glycosyltransferase family 2 protein [Deltaproteobacteria bacterium]|nr:glycosyltransferase family 2 protein [Deltaproteobacteria bacterium]MBW2392829.1 glycosyltransferase family 2 protein [Deltaproteobacteria bacterium]